MGNGSETTVTAEIQLCSVCYSFDQKTLEARKKLDHTLPCARLFESARSGCKTCQILENAILGFYRVEATTTHTWFGWFVGSIYISGRTPAERPADPEVGKDSAINIKLFRKYKAPCPWEFFHEEHIIAAHSLCEGIKAWIVDKMERCLASHAECNAGMDGASMPTRVLDVGFSSVDDDPVKVLETDGPQGRIQGRYLALSHCWGDPNLMSTKLTADTIEEYKKRIPYASLPRTFHDAVLVARKLGFQYLWIDSLRIIQSDGSPDTTLSDQDWGRETSRMSQVYRNAHLTLNAPTSTSCHGGLLFDTKSIDISVPGAGGPGTDPFEIFARKRTKDQQSDWPLITPGWAAQEYFLAPRTLVFTDTELVWRCRKAHACQCQSGPGPAILVPWEYNKLLEPSVRNPSRPAIYSMWTDTFVLVSLWHMSHRTTRTRYRTAEPDMTRLRPVWSVGDSLFPTYSWASVPYAVTWVPDVMEEMVGRPPGEVVMRGRLVRSTVAEVRRYCHFDCEGEPEDDVEVCCLRLVCIGDDYFSLALRRKEEGREVFERLGLLWGSKREGEPLVGWWHGGGEVDDVTLTLV
ncbi:hypothetical protein QBC34DRAFT_462383 [Podospora aff. communis PSN243]|uniref:Heterokaryon incompatibility domain-containing protein n=1 Tax=Podospora aff. communis PSN243 TaxID=3040156 RepID=A0AAV9GML3_9PEZI|nr:hypothetical protein QBC34DRAFT_462383 [Podospora aff. communis PSN243]